MSSQSSANPLRGSRESRYSIPQEISDLQSLVRSWGLGTQLNHMLEEHESRSKSTKRPLRKHQERMRFLQSACKSLQQGYIARDNSAATSAWLAGLSRAGFELFQTVLDRRQMSLSSSIAEIQSTKETKRCVKERMRAATDRDIVNVCRRLPEVDSVFQSTAKDRIIKKRSVRPSGPIQAPKAVKGHDFTPLGKTLLLQYAQAEHLYGKEPREPRGHQTLSGADFLRSPEDGIDWNAWADYPPVTDFHTVQPPEPLLIESGRDDLGSQFGAGTSSWTTEPQSLPIPSTLDMSLLPFDLGTHYLPDPVSVPYPASLPSTEQRSQVSDFDLGSIGHPQSFANRLTMPDERSHGPNTAAAYPNSRDSAHDSLDRRLREEAASWLNGEIPPIPDLQSQVPLIAAYEPLTNLQPQPTLGSIPPAAYLHAPHIASDDPSIPVAGHAVGHDRNSSMPYFHPDDDPLDPQHVGGYY